MLSSLALLAESANKIKLWQVEIERDINQEVDKAGKASQSALHTKPDIPKRDVLSAARVETLVGTFPDSPVRDEILNSVRHKMYYLADQYDDIRASMTSGDERTIAMNGIAAQMRALAIAAKPWLKEFSRNESSAGTRLCAITILQMAPDRRYVDWLGERFTSEQPFIFYHAAIALLEAVRAFGIEQQQKLDAVITGALEKLRAFKGGTPDYGSINILQMALQMLESHSESTDR
ncbi:MAG TPA: hypothetical protein VMF56_01060 [Acidobacteriaceae bacterium]|nr:hypothetical protein [Acidobacteriaceae bacterium]